MDASALDRTVERAAAAGDTWCRTPIAERIALLEGCGGGIAEVADSWVRAACLHKGIDADSPLAGEEWLSGPFATLEALRHYQWSLRRGGAPVPPHRIVNASGQVRACVLPRGLLDRFLFHGVTAEVWIRPGHPETQGRIYREKEAGRVGRGSVALVLGAGNVSSIGPLDALYQLLAEDRVVVLKLNPVNDYLAPWFERAFRPLIDRGFLALVKGGKESGAHLCRHPRIDCVHLTGSRATHDAIVWGATPEEQARRRREGRPLLDKPVTSELGCVTPIVVVGGSWSPAQLSFQARHVAAMVAHNASFNCTAGKVLVLPRDWPARASFLDRVRSALSATAARRAYYPGAAERHRRFVERYPRAEPLGTPAAQALPWTLIPDVPPREDEYALTEEAFCGVLAEVALEGREPGTYLDAAVEFVNEKVWGTLSCVVLVDDRTRRAHEAAVERAVERLCYGSIGINVWTGVNFALAGTTWGGYVGDDAADVGSGRGVVHNAFFFDHPQKSVVRSRFRSWPTPPWFADHATLDELGRALTRFSARRSALDLLRALAAGMRG